ncbi:MAG: leucyl aminopeptidase [Nitrospirae bacterium]|nr:MAG: leucyl aminopeptidase [Nitrospirota bacterium]
MKFTATPRPAKARKGRALALFLAEEEEARHSLLPELERLPALAQAAGFKAKRERIATVTAEVGATAVPVVLVGMGAREKVDDEALRQGAARLVKQLEAMGVERCDLCLGAGAEEAHDPGRAIAEGAVLGSYRFEAFKSEPDKERKPVKELALHLPESRLDCAREGLAFGALLARGACFARDLANRPGNACTPTYLAQQARALAKKGGRVKVRVLSEAQMRRLGMNALLGVSKGSAEEAKLICLEYTPKGRASETVAVVGKGLTFDSGGISLKPGKKMDEMKYDMCGGAAVLGLFSILEELAPRQRVLGFVPSSENLPDAAAQKPGDIVTAFNGKTIEILNTDAEGRLILADALAYAATFEPAAMVDLATLTGAVITCLGHVATGVMANDDGLRDQIVAAGERSGERCWPLPLWDDYHKAIEAKTADIQNIGDGTAGTINGGMFLKEFVGEVPWAHLDIAGTAWGGRDVGYYDGKGAAGVGVRLLAQWLTDRA